MAIDVSKWTITGNRFVGFFDILGFKDLVERNDHETVVSKLNALKQTLANLERACENETFMTKHALSETKAITFSDSIIIFSKGDDVSDACKIILDSGFLIQKAIENGLAIKGALSYGQITVDFVNSLFFGRPIIDAYLLHDTLHLYSAVIDNKLEAKLNKMELPQLFSKRIISYKGNFKTGKITHKFIIPDTKKCFEKQYTSVTNLYESVSGSPRIYVDNTIDYLNSISKNYS